MKTNEIVQAIREQQIECSHHVYIELLTEEEIEKLLLEEKYFYREKDNKILVAFYLKLLSKKNKIYRLGGFTVSNIENPSFYTKRETIKLLTKLQQYIFRHNINFIAKTNTISFENFCIDLEAKKVSFQECLEQYPLFLKEYIDNSIEDEELFKSKIFYVREGNGE